MRILIEYRHPTPAHCDVAVFVNGANAGTLRLRQDELASFESILRRGCETPGDDFVARGDTECK